jgi:hypothetical protein
MVRNASSEAARSANARGRCAPLKSSFIVRIAAVKLLRHFAGN